MKIFAETTSIFHQKNEAFPPENWIDLAAKMVVKVVKAKVGGLRVVEAPSIQKRSSDSQAGLEEWGSSGRPGFLAKAGKWKRIHLVIQDF